MASGVASSDSEAYIMITLSKKEKQRQQQAKNGYWQNELYSLGMVDPKEKNLTIAKNSKTFLTVSNRLCFRLTN
jgi:hypothetical protein